MQEEDKDNLNSPALSASFDLGLLQNLNLEKAKVSNDGTMAMHQFKDSVTNKKQKKTQPIGKKEKMKRSYKRRQKLQESSHKKIIKLESRIKELEEQLQTNQRKDEFCPNCLFNLKQTQKQLKENFQTNYDEEMKKIATSMDTSKISRESLQFQKMDFNCPSLFNSDMDEKAWIYLGTLMIIMGSKCLDVDGTINVFKVLKESVDSMRRQLEKCAQTITMDFFLTKEEMQENSIAQQIGFDPFTQKQTNDGLLLEGVKIESVEQFQLVYDNKVTFNLKYDALISAMEYMRNSCWISF